MWNSDGKDFAHTSIHWFENEVLRQCGISKERFHKVRGNQWENIYQAVTEKFADKTKTWKNGLHWANINGYSPKSMKNYLGSYCVDYSTWFYQLPEIVPEDEVVYFLIDSGREWYFGEKFWIFEGAVPELIKVLALLSETAFLEMGWLDYYIVSKKYRWILGFNHHDMVSLVGEGINPGRFSERVFRDGEGMT